MTMHVTKIHTTGQRPDSAALVGEAISLVKEYVKTVPVAPAELPKLISSVFETLASIASDGTAKTEGADVAAFAPALPEGSRKESPMKEAKPTAKLSRKPAVPIKDSIHNDYLVCLFDGAKKLMLKRYLRSNYGMEWEDYIRHFDLPADYPSVAPGYAAEKSAYAKKVGLGSLIDKTPRHLRDRKADAPTPASARRERAARLAKTA